MFTCMQAPSRECSGRVRRRWLLHVAAWRLCAAARRTVASDDEESAAKRKFRGMSEAPFGCAACLCAFRRMACRYGLMLPEVSSGAVESTGEGGAGSGAAAGAAEGEVLADPSGESVPVPTPA